MAGFFHADLLGQVVLQVQRQVAFDGCLLPAVLGPRHAVGDQRNGRGVHGEDRLLQPAQEPLAWATHDERIRPPGALAAELPIQLRRHRAVPNGVGMREGIAARRRRLPDTPHLPRMLAHRIADVVEPERMRQVRIHQAYHVAPRTERPAFPVHPVLPRQVRHQQGRNEVANLIQNSVRRLLGWFVGLFHPLPSGKEQDFKPAFFLSPSDSCGMAVEKVFAGFPRHGKMPVPPSPRLRRAGAVSLPAPPLCPSVLSVVKSPCLLRDKGVLVLQHVGSRPPGIPPVFRIFHAMEKVFAGFPRHGKNACPAFAKATAGRLGVPARPPLCAPQCSLW